LVTTVELTAGRQLSALQSGSPDYRFGVACILQKPNLFFACTTARALLSCVHAAAVAAC
jgi:hypothetical protein